jgi:hypothetical protein
LELGGPGHDVARVLSRDHHEIVTGNSITKRLVIGSLNTAGQARQWASALSEHAPARAEAWVLESTGGSTARFAFDRSFLPPTPSANPMWSAILNEAPRVTHVLIESAKPIGVKGRRRRLFAQTASMVLRGVTPALLFHGSDLRIPSVHRKTHQDSPFHEAHGDLTATLEERTQSISRLVKFWPLTTFVSTIDLRAFAPRSRWLPVVIEPEWFGSMAPINTDRPRPRVLHLPSRRELFQSELIDQVCIQLNREQVIEYKSATCVSPAEVRSLVEWSDIVIDKIGIGGTGVMGAEVMASGRLLIGDIDQIVRDELSDLPLIQSSTGTLEQVIRGLVADRSTWAARAAAGQAFARKYHDGRYSAAVLAKWMGVPLNGE